MSRAHLGDQVSALADGQLDHHRRDQALAHLAHCPDCRTGAEDERRVRETLRLMPDPVVPARLRDALLAVPSARAFDDGGPAVPPRPDRLPRDAAGTAAWLRALDGAPVAPDRGGRASRRPAGRSGPTGPGRSRRSRLPVLALGAVLVGALALSGVAARTLPGTAPAPVQQLRVPAATSAAAAATTATRSALPTTAAASPVVELAPASPQGSTWYPSIDDEEGVP